MSNAQSVTTYVMAPELPWPDVAVAADALGALDPAAFRFDGRSQPCRVRRLSALGATLCGTGLPGDGAAVGLELETGQRAAGTLDWCKGGEAGLRFAQPIDMVSLLNRKLISQPGERRTMPRVEVRCAVGLSWGINVAAATLRNISAGGVQVEGEGLPAWDTFVSLAIAGFKIRSGIVIWQKGDLAGIEFMEAMGWSALMQWVRDTMRGQIQ